MSFLTFDKFPSVTSSLEKATTLELIELIEVIELIGAKT